MIYVCICFHTFLSSYVPYFQISLFSCAIPHLSIHRSIQMFVWHFSDISDFEFSIRGRCLFTLRTTTDFKMLKEQELQVFIFPVGGAGYIGPGVKGQKPQAVELCTWLMPLDLVSGFLCVCVCFHCVKHKPVVETLHYYSIIACCDVCVGNTWSLVFAVCIYS